MRECGECTLCCTVTRVPELAKSAGTKCEHCLLDCTIYEKRPQSCVDFNCGWIQGDMDESMRPDKSHVMIERMPGIDDVVIAYIESGHRDIVDEIEKPLREAYVDKGISVLCNNGNGLLVEGISGEYVMRRIAFYAKKIGLIDGRTIL